MDPRDEFAKSAMEALILTWYNDQRTVSEIAGMLAADAYQIADAMVAAKKEYEDKTWAIIRRKYQ